MTDEAGRDTAALNDALERLAGTGFEFEGYLSNHGPMASDALIELGARDAVPRWVDRYRRRLDLAPEPGLPIPADDGGGSGDGAWRGALGDYGRVADWTEFFGRALGEEPWTDVLARWWPRLLPGLVAAATHGVIRTAHAVRAIDRSGAEPSAELRAELAHGLGYWAARYHELPGSAALHGSRTVGEALARLPRLDPDTPSAGPGILGRVAGLESLSGFAQGLDEYGARTAADEELGQVTAAAARVFVANPGPAIPLIHSLTAPAAVKLVLPHLPAEQHRPSLAAAWQASAALIGAFAVETTIPAPPAPEEQRTQEALAARAAEHGDEHVIKMTEACLREYRANPDAYYLFASDAAIRAIPPRS
jgi:questin oxidase-like protein